MKKNSIFLTGLIVIVGYCLRAAFLFAGATVTPWEKYVRAAELFQADSTTQQIKVLCRNVRKETDDPVLFSRATLLLSDVYQRDGKLEKVHRLLQQIYTGNFAPKTIMQEAKLRDGQIFLLQKKHLLAKKLFSDVAQNTFNSFLRQEGRLALAWQYADDIQWTLCDSVLSEIVDEQPAYNKDERMLVLRARQNIAKVNPNAAIALLKKAHGKQALRYLAQAYEQAGKPILAVGVYNKIHDLYRDSPEAEAALFQGAEVFMKSGDWMAARSELQRFLDVYPQTRYLPMINFRLGWIAFKLEKYDEALNYFQNVSTDITESYIAFMEAECYRSMGKKDAGKLHEAVLKYNHIIALYPNSVLAPLAELRMALTLLDEGEKKDAIISLRQFLSLHPKDDLASAATFLLATHVDEPKKSNYFTTILSRFPGQDVFDAALAALQKQDYDKANYQKIINRKAYFNIPDNYPSDSYYQRAYHLLLAESAYYLHQYDEAKTEYARVINSQDDNLNRSAELGQAWCILQANEAETAVEKFAGMRMKFTGTDYIQASYGLASAYFRMRRFQDAIETYPLNFENDALPTLYPLMAQSYFRVGECYYRLQYYNQAIEMWQKLVGKYPESDLAPEAQYKVADTFFRADHFDEASAAFQQVLINYRNSEFASKSILGLGQSEYNAGHYENAVKYYQRFVHEYPQDDLSKDAIDGLMLCYYQLGETEEATETLQKVIDQSPGSPLAADARYKIGENYFEGQQYDNAIQSFKEILTRYPGSSYSMDAQFTLALAFAKKGDFHSANNEFARYVQYFPHSSQIPEALFNLAVGYFNVKSYVSAVDYFKRIIEEFPNSVYFQKALQNIGLCYENLEDKEKAIEYYKQYLVSFPNDADSDKIKLSLAKLSVETDKTKEALALYRSLRLSNDRDIATEAAFRLGMAELKLKNADAATEAFILAIRKGEKDNYFRLNALSQLAAIYETSQKWQKAIKLYEMLIDSTSEEKWAEAARQRITLIKSTIKQ